MLTRCTVGGPQVCPQDLLTRELVSQLDAPQALGFGMIILLVGCDRALCLNKRLREPRPNGRCVGQA